jgi:hypothetical protein
LQSDFISAVNHMAQMLQIPYTDHMSYFSSVCFGNLLGA